MRIIENKEKFCFWSNLEPVTSRTNIFPIRDLSLLFVFLSSAILGEEDDDFLSSITSDNNASLLKRSIRIRHIIIKYRIIAYYLTLSGVAYSQIYEPLCYKSNIISKR